MHHFQYGKKPSYKKYPRFDREKDRFMLDADRKTPPSRDIKAKPIVRKNEERDKTTTVSNIGPIPILLVTYMRSGSSFVGDLLKANPKTFYSFEPLHKLQVDVRNQRPIYYLDGTLRNPRNFMEISADTIGDLSTCTMENLPLSFYQDGFFHTCTDSSKFQLCMNKTKLEANLEKGRSCIRIITKACRDSEYIVAKIIRIPLHALESLLKNIPTLKIIHLLRDPRSTLISQFKAGRYTRDNMQRSVVRFCNRVYDDINTREVLNRKYPGRIMVTEYEDIVREPLTYTKQMYKFSGMKFTKRVEKEITRLTSKTKTRVNSTVISSKWRINPLEYIIKSANDNCQQLYTKYGLKSLNVKDLQNVSISLKVKSAPVFDDFRNE
ncbi:carbohydrate sulfotransferase 1-like [Pecten maximus]|uniref:carbohydrate sulfotransferase 1-like n=1 Tax=Pecten maximus TaxID=6579 RepID=UPI001457F9D4|nr:carbohydrate sulfotransferase 1-like [Pecten maximus]